MHMQHEIYIKRANSSVQDRLLGSIITLITTSTQYYIPYKITLYFGNIIKEIQVYPQAGLFPSTKTIDRCEITLRCTHNWLWTPLEK